MRPGFLLLLATSLALGGCFPEPYPHSNPDDPDYSGTPIGDDADGDGYGADEDCNDDDPTINPGATDIPYDGIDQDCAQGDMVDVDGDGYVAAEAGGGDCDDTDAAINDGASEVCDGVDNDCDGGVDVNATDADTFYPDEDGDSYGDSDGAPFDACEPPEGYADNSDDCDDDNEDVAPGATEVCDEVDNNCNDRVDENAETTFYLDADGDGFGDDENTVEACEPPDEELYVDEGGDCNDAAAIAYPGAEEACEETGRTPLDNDCDGNIDEGVGSPFFVDGDSDGYGDDGETIIACSLPDGASENGGDCDDEDSDVSPDASEVCDEGEAFDNDCDGNIDEGVGDLYYLDDDGDGFAGEGEGILSCEPVEGSSAETGDCDDTDEGVYPGAPEACGDDIDSDCDGDNDPGDLDGDGTADCSDDDGDGYCEADVCPDGLEPGDCDDGDPAVNPGATEIINVSGDAVDEDCDDAVDEGFDVDLDLDGYTLADGDCDDTDSDINPGAEESLNGVDDNCDGVTDEDVPISGSPQWSVDGALALGAKMLGSELTGVGPGLLVAATGGDAGVEGYVMLISGEGLGEDGSVSAKAIFTASPDDGSLTLGDVGDFNGDGHQDLALGLPERSATCVILGREEGSSASVSLPDGADFCIEEESASLGAVDRIVFLDLDGDAREELILGAPTYVGEEEDTGRSGAVVIFKGRDVELPADSDEAPVLDLEDADFVVFEALGDGFGSGIFGLKGEGEVPNRLAIEGENLRLEREVVWILDGSAAFPGEELTTSEDGNVYLLGSDATQMMMSSYGLGVMGPQGDSDFDGAEELALLATADESDDVNLVYLLSSGSLSLSTGGDVTLDTADAALSVPLGEEGSFGAAGVTFTQGAGRVLIGSPNAPADGDSPGAGRVYGYELSTLTEAGSTRALPSGDGAALFSLLGSELGAALGSAMVVIDLDGDGIDDVYAGAPGALEGAGAIFQCPLDSGVFDR